MHATCRRLLAGSLVFLLVVSMAGGSVALQPETTLSADRQGATSAGLMQTSDDTIELTHGYARTDQPGEVAVTLTYAIPDRVTSFRTTLPANATVTDTDGFDSVNDTVYEWDEATATATIALSIDPNETTERTGPVAGPGQYIFADTGEWALFSPIRTGAQWSYTGTSDDPVTFERSVTTDGPGVAGDELVYLGNVTTTERTANGQTFRLVVPEQATLAEPTDEILDSLVEASGSMQVGDRDGTVLAIAAPTDGIQWGVRGLELGDAEFWVRDRERLDSPSNVWLHEYVHTRQGFSTTSETRWVTEGTAVYYAALLSLEQDRVDFDSFSTYLDNGERSAYSDVVLSDPGTWTQSASYLKGGLVAGLVDEAMREETNQTATFEDVMRDLNDISGPVTQAQFLAAVEDNAGPTSRATAVDYTETTAAPSMWTETTHSRLFGVLPASVDYALPNSTAGYRASGPYRNATVGTAPPEVVTGETLTVDTVVRNTGGEAGTYNATLTVDGRVVDSANGTVDAESERVVPLSYTFEDTGVYTLGVGSETTTVTVSDPADPSVTTLSVTDTRVQQGERTVVTATVANDATIPANGSVVLTRNDEPATRRVVSLAPGNSTQLSVEMSFPEAGTVRIGSGTATPVTVTVTAPPTATPSPTRIVGGSGPGFTAITALLVAVLTLLVGRRRR